ncbi:MAG: nucleotidyltransferase domain-containing protein [Candidatus Helarchaeota archaeon]|nr:nucleotidyltransferase domain-containing protein [Candidatus Helarchaeota archaeon]
MKKSDWQYPRDGDIILTDDFFIFYTMGYDHPKDRVISYLKYIPAMAKNHFDLDWIPLKWQFLGREYVRPKKLYSPKIFKSIETTFVTHFPEYLYFSKNWDKTVFAIPYDKIKKEFVPQSGLNQLVKLKKKDILQKKAIKLITTLSDYSKIPLTDFGIHGSLLTSMHAETSDIDIAVYGANNFKEIKKTVKKLEEEKIIRYLFEIPTDKIRKNKGVFENQKFVFNAIRKILEIRNNYKIFEYKAIKSIQFQCKIIDSSLAMFRPALYRFKDFMAENPGSKLKEDQEPIELVSMIGEFRDVVQKDQIAKVSGMLEKVKNTRTGDIYHRVVVGSGVGEEFILPFDEL